MGLASFLERLDFDEEWQRDLVEQRCALNFHDVLSVNHLAKVFDPGGGEERLGKLHRIHRGHAELVHEVLLESE